jgi:hypothetical protein
MHILPASPAVRPSRTNIIAIGVIVVTLVVIGILVSNGGGAPVAGRGRALPRIPAPPADPVTLLRRLGVGSVTWYACALAIPPLWWLAFRFPLTGQRALARCRFTCQRSDAHRRHFGGALPARVPTL